MEESFGLHNMTDNPLISIIVPVYKVEPYLARCVDSLINQTYQNLEIILVDDGSPDRCGEICEEYAKKDSRIVVFHKDNGGLSDARNKGLDIATGDYVMFVDSDDWIEKETCETVIKLAASNKSDIVIFGVRNVYDNGQLKNFVPMYNGNISSEECIKALLYKIQKKGIFNYACNKIYKRVLFDNIRFQSGRLAEDQGVTYKLFHLANNICVCNNCFYNYYQRIGSITTSQYSPHLIQDRHALWLERLDFLRKYYPNLEKYQLAQILGAVYVGLIVLKNRGEYSILRKTISVFAKKYRHKEQELIHYDRRVKLHYYCYPLFWVYVKLFIK